MIHGASLTLPYRSKDFGEGVNVDRLNEVMIKARLFRPAQVFFLPPSGQRDISPFAGFFLERPENIVPADIRQSEVK
jgi:hypothetical protein